MNHTQPDGAQGTAIIEPTQRQLQPATTVEELSANQTDSAVDMEVLDFTTTAELEPLDEIVGQSRAMSALDVGLGIQQPGYNIFAAGLTGSGKMETIRRSLQRHLDGSRPPDDWIYVHNFDDPDQPWAITLEPGHGRRFEKEMDHLILQLKEALPKAFRQQEFREEKEQLSRKYESRLDDLTDRLSNMAKERGFEVAFLPTGQISFLPHIDGKPAETPQQLETLPPEERDRIAEGERELAREVAHLMQDQRQMVQNLTEEVRSVERQFAGYVVAPLIEAIKESYQGNDRVLQYLDRTREHILDNLADFRERPRPGSPAATAGYARAGQRPPVSRVQGQRDRGQQPNQDRPDNCGRGAHLPEPLREHRSRGGPKGSARHGFHADQGGQPAAPTAAISSSTSRTP